MATTKPKKSIEADAPKPLPPVEETAEIVLAPAEPTPKVAKEEPAPLTKEVAPAPKSKATEPKAAEPAKKVEEKPVAKPRRSLKIDWLSSGLLLGALLMVGAVGYLATMAIQATTTKSEIQLEVATKIDEAKAKSKSVPTVPTLKLNKSNSRLGPEVNVNPDDLGKDNPFSTK